MNKLRKTVPVILIIWPYLLVFCLFLPGYRFTLPFYAFFTAIVYIFNIWNAWTYPYGETRRDLIFWNMLQTDTYPFLCRSFCPGMSYAACHGGSGILTCVASPSFYSGNDRYLSYADHIHVWNQRCCKIKERRTDFQPVCPSSYHSASFLCNGCSQRSLPVLQKPETPDAIRLILKRDDILLRSPVQL